jgi:hypothetical protein
MKNELKLRIALLAPVLFSIALALNPTSRNYLKDLFSGNSREVIRTIEYSPGEEFGSFQIVKIKTEEGLTLEFYKKSPDGVIELFQKELFNNCTEARVNLGGTITSLAFDDVDGDGVGELLIPYYDPNMVARVSVFKFNPLTKRFESLNISPN